MTRGFTLIETIVTVGIFAIVVTALSILIQYFYRTNAYIFEETAAVQSAHNGIIDAMHYLREASYGADGSYPIVNAATSTVTFYVDIKGDGVVDKVRYYLSGTTLYKSIVLPTGVPPTYIGQPENISTIATYVRATTTPIFRYYNSVGAQLTTPIDVAKITSVNTTITVNLNPTRAPNNYTLSAGATLRNLHIAQ